MSGAVDISKPEPRFQVDVAFYDSLRALRSHFLLTARTVVPPYSGKGFIVTAGQTFRIVEETGCQIADVAVWNAHDPGERFGTMRSWLVEGWIIRPNTRLWSDLPWFRPMLTCLGDTVAQEPGADYHHHFMGTHCSAETVEKNYGLAGLDACRLNLLQAIEPFGLGERHLRDNINLHEKDRLDQKTGRRSIGPGDAKAGDYIEFYAEMDVLIAVSVCPFGDGSADPTQYRQNVVRPIAVEIYDTGIQSKGAPAWSALRTEGRGNARLA